MAFQCLPPSLVRRARCRRGRRYADRTRRMRSATPNRSDSANRQARNLRRRGRDTGGRWWTRARRDRRRRVPRSPNPPKSSADWPGSGIAHSPSPSVTLNQSRLVMPSMLPENDGPQIRIVVLQSAANEIGNRIRKTDAVDLTRRDVARVRPRRAAVASTWRCHRHRPAPSDYRPQKSTCRGDRGARRTRRS